MNGHWWRAYDEAVDEPKLILLSDAQHRAWFNLLCLASANDGKLPALKIVCVKLRVSSKRAEKLIADLIDAALFEGRDGEIVPHNWSGRQYKSDVTDPTNAERQRRYRKRYAVTANTVTVKRPDTDTDTDTEKKENKQKKEAARKTPRHCELPADWQPKPRHYEKGKRFDLSVSEVEVRADDLRSWARAKAIRRADWDATFDGFLKPKERNGNGWGPRPLQDDSKSASRAAARLAEAAERGEFIFGPKPGLLPEPRQDDASLLPPRRGSRS